MKNILFLQDVFCAMFFILIRFFFFLEACF